MGCIWSDVKIKDHDSRQSAGTVENSGASSTKVESKRLSRRSEGEILQSSNLKIFTYNDLALATNNFGRKSLLGEGGFGCVYKGLINDHTSALGKPSSEVLIAVKKLNEEGFQGHQEWLTEITYLGQLQHPNLVKLVGYCMEEEHHLLAYEFMPHGSLDSHLFRRSSSIEPLSWKLRLKIVLGAAKGLAFLHSPKIKVIFRDFKPSNILLNSDYTAKLSDFGLAKDGPLGENSFVSTRIMGTRGYVAPEYMSSGHLTARSDIYSFGVVLLEIMTGKRILDGNRCSKEQNLINWARPYLRKGKVSAIMDSAIQGQYSSNSAKLIGNIVIECLSIDPRFRPSMEEIVSALVQLPECGEDLYPIKPRVKHRVELSEGAEKVQVQVQKHEVEDAYEPSLTPPPLSG